MLKIGPAVREFAITVEAFGAFFQAVACFGTAAAWMYGGMWLPYVLVVTILLSLPLIRAGRVEGVTPDVHNQ